MSTMSVIPVTFPRAAAFWRGGALGSRHPLISSPTSHRGYLILRSRSLILSSVVVFQNTLSKTSAIRQRHVRLYAFARRKE
ncbi:hypothetical protein BJX66DRAFT_306023 [Aspergillus keveii]|uniref:Uncharacterized protein n=1 Tax=Aspergillus keveii TaxID=714993 RepID=A0ABR4G396_9EURO